MELLNKVGFWDVISGLFDVIPKTIYYLYAALASGIDALQSLVRKLAGLDTYWTATSGSSSQPVVGQDPLSEFVYGILGVGDSASVYKALNTVFWSLAIFGLIMLVVSTMIAIIKSHYNEDTAGTSPWKYIYTAIKAILTFAVIPVVVVLGMSLSTFALSTLDKIVAGSANDGAIQGIYNSSATTYLDSENGTYSHYDFFGAQEFTTSTPFSGMLFKASAYNANRARSGDAKSYSTAVAKLLDYNSIFDVIVGDEEGLAYQIDYSFANCLMYKEEERPSYNDWRGVLDSEVFVGLLDLWKPTKIGGFTKWNVSTVWLFYDLWQFNFIVGFTGVTASFAILMSIVFGLLTRLIKGAALFLIFPALLGIAPMDNFRAFKAWGTQFMQQILMVFGAILGLNLLLLILPYIQNISFFNPSKASLGVLNAIMDVVILVVGLQMAKDFINIVNGFVGGADAVSAGDAAKAGTKDAIMKGAKTAIGAGKVGAFAGMAAGKAAIGIGKTGVKAAIGVGKSGVEAVSSLSAFGATRRADKAKTKADKALDNWGEADKNLKTAESNALKWHSGRINDAGNKAYKKARGAGATDEEAREQAKTAREEVKASILKDDDGYQEALKDYNKAEKKALKTDEKFNTKMAKHGLKWNKTDKKSERTQTAGEEFKGRIKKAIVDDGLIKAKGEIVKAKDKFVGESATYKKDASGKEVLDDKGRKIVEKQGSGLKGLGASIGNFAGPLAKNLGSELLKNTTTWGGIGKNIADGFAKSFAAGTSALGLDKLSKDLMSVAGELKQTTIKPPPDKTKLEGLEGEKLTKSIAEQQKTRDEAQLKLLEEMAESLKKMRDSSTGSSK